MLVPVVEPNAEYPDEQAQLVYAALNGVSWLTTDGESQRIRLREDIRAVMLQYLDATEHGRMLQRQVRERAIKFHSQREGEWDEAMITYHLCRQNAQSLSGPTSRALRLRVEKYASYLYRFADELPPNVRAKVTLQSGETLGPETAISALSDEDWVLYLDGSNGKAGFGQKLVEKSPSQVLDLYQRRPTTNGVPPNYVLQAIADTGALDYQSWTVDEAVHDIFSQLEQAPRRWQPLLQRLFWITRLSLLEESDKRRSFSLEHALSTILEKCSPYGAMLPLVDLFASAEAIYRRRFFPPKFMFARPPKHHDFARLVLVRANVFDEIVPDALVQVPTVLIFSPPSSIREGYISNFDLIGGVESGEVLHQKPWSYFQAEVRSWRKIPPIPVSSFLSIANSLIERGLQPCVWPEFYRPLRHLTFEMLKEYDFSPGFVYGLGEVFERSVPLLPRELMPENFVQTISGDAKTWLYAMYQHADRCGLLLPFALSVQSRFPMNWKFQALTRSIAVMQASIGLVNNHQLNFLKKDLYINSDNYRKLR